MTTEEKIPFMKKPWMSTIIGSIIIILILVGALTFKLLTSRISIDRSQLSAPVISISPSATGILDEVYIENGAEVTPGTPLARVGGETLTAKVAGIVIKVNKTPGQLFSPSQPVVQMIVPTELRLVGLIKENEGLADIHVGDPVRFTVDAYDSTSFIGVVDSINPTSKDSSLAFSISDKREVKEFEVNVRYDTAAHPEFKNGMSAKMKIYHK